jgi:hypothetical protein
MHPARTTPIATLSLASDGRIHFLFSARCTVGARVLIGAFRYAGWSDT